jgi:hypothetical protein
MSLIAEIATAYGTLTSQTPFVTERPAESTAAAWTVVAPYGGKGDDTIPTQELWVQFACHSTSQATALAAAEAGRAALHGKHAWTLTNWYVGHINCGPVTTLPPTEAQGGRNYRAVFSARMAVRPKS